MKETRILALKQLKSRQNECNFADFCEEVAMLKYVNSLHHPHVVELLATYEIDGQFCMLFPWAEQNLHEFWTRSDLGSLDVNWHRRQIAGLASGLASIHNNMPAKKSLLLQALPEKDRRIRGGWHHDLKPSNILFFQPGALADGNEESRFMISDFGTGGFRKYDEAPGPIPYIGSTTYEAPECQISTLTEKLTYLPDSQAYDIWSLGCIFMEWAIWILMGPHALEGFTKERFVSAEMPGVNIRDDNFFTIKYDAISRPTHAIIRNSVEKWLQKLREHADTNNSLSQLLALIANGLLQVDPSNRLDAEAVSRQLERFLDR